MSTLEVSNLNDGTTTVATTFVTNGSAKMWVNFDGTASGAAARDSLNLSSMTDQGTGNYDISIASAMASANYCYAGAANGAGSSNSMPNGDAALNASTIFIRTLNTADNFQDSDGVYIIAHGDLA